MTPPPDTSAIAAAAVKGARSVSQGTFDKAIAAIQKVGLPAVVCLILLWMGYKLGDRFLDQQERFLEAAMDGQKQMLAIQMTQSETLKSLAESHRSLTDELRGINQALERNGT